jgi:glutaconate CoA-transferase subunit B
MQLTPDEMIVFSISRQVKDKDVVVQGLATPLVAAALLLARQTHAPNLYFASAIGQGMCRIPAPLGLTTVEELWIERSLRNISFVQVAAEILPWLQPLEFFRPAQVDACGNFNNIAFGSDYYHPRLRLPGTGGIPDMTVFSQRNFLYVPRHSRLTFVKELHHRSGFGHNTTRTAGAGPLYLVSDLGQFDFADGKMRLISNHPDVSLDTIQSKTGFDLMISDELEQTPLPTKEELKLLREEIDPLGIRRLELLTGSERKLLLHEIIEREKRHNLP